MNRRTLITSALASTALAGPLQAQSKLQVIYIGGWDCGPCNYWKSTYKKDWLASPEYKQVTWIEIEAPHLKEAYEDRYWPTELRPVRDQLPVKAGTPRFVIVKDGKVVSNQFRGDDFWTRTVADIKKGLAG